MVVAVRPEEVKLGKSKDGDGLNQVPCVVETAVFLGDRYECHLRFGTNTFTLYTGINEPFSSGQKLYMGLSDKNIRIWRKTDATPLVAAGSA